MLDRTTQPKVSTFKDLHFTYPEYRTLDNGIKLYTVNSGDLDIIQLEVIYRGGYFDQEKLLTTEFLAQILNLGTEKYTSKDIAEKLDYYGASITARPADDHTCISLKTLERYFGPTLDVLCDIVKHPSFPENEFELLKKQFQSIIAYTREHVGFLSYEGICKLFYGEKHPRGQKLEVETTEKITLKDLQDFFKKYFRPNNCTIIISGKFSEKDIELVNKTFGQDVTDESKSPLNDFEKEPSNEHLLIVKKEDAVQSSINMMCPSVLRQHPDYIKIRILINALGGYFGSRLMSNIREDKGYTYGINAYLAGNKRESYIAISTDCDTKYTQSVIDETFYEINRLRNEPIGEIELETVKNEMLSELAKVLDTPFSIAGNIRNNIYFNTGEDYMNEQVKEITNITPNDLLHIAKKYLVPENFYVCVAGNINDLHLV